MAEREIKIGFPEAKMEALEFFLKENDTTVEKVLREHLDKTYEKSVPQQVRKFVESKMTPQTEEPAQNEAGNARHGRGREEEAPDSRPQERLFRSRKITEQNRLRSRKHRNRNRSRLAVCP